VVDSRRLVRGEQPWSHYHHDQSDSNELAAAGAASFACPTHP
jgi:hypothetical protein